MSANYKTMIEPEVIHQLLNEDENFYKQIRHAKKEFACIERYNPLHYKLKIEAIKNQLIDTFIIKYIIKRDIVTKLCSKIIEEYFEKNKSHIKDYMSWIYFNYTGADRFYSKIARNYYINTGIEPYVIKNHNNQ